MPLGGVAIGWGLHQVFEQALGEGSGGAGHFGLGYEGGAAGFRFYGGGGDASPRCCGVAVHTAVMRHLR